jgi:putative flippase GtrA
MRNLKQFSTYVLVGVASAVIDIGLMQFLVATGLGVVVAATIGFLAGLVANFVLHTGVTFSVKYSNKGFLRFLIVVLINYLLTIICVGVSNAWLELPLVGKLVSLPIVAVNGYILIKYWVYREALNKLQI